jgi:hypothetical protein
MTDNGNRPPPGAPWIWETGGMLDSDAWRSLSVNGYRLLSFLKREHMAHAGKANGRLKAPRRQLEIYGIGARYISDAIALVERVGFIDSHHAGMRVAVAYALTWLPLHDGTPATNRWRAFHDPSLPPLTFRKSRNLTSLGKSGLTSQGKSDASNLTAKGKSDAPLNLTAKGKSLLRSSYQDGGNGMEELA